MDSLFDFNTEEEKPIDIKPQAVKQKTEIIQQKVEYHTKYSEIFQKITQQFDNGTLHHAMILYGLRGIGKRNLANQVAKYILIKSSTMSEGQIESLFHVNTHPDFFLLESKSAISIDEVRKMLNFTSLKPSLGNGKVVIIDTLECMNKSAVNAILKTLEEPQEDTYFIIISHDLSLCIDTVCSRALKYQIINDDIYDFMLDDKIKTLCLQDANIVKYISKGSIGYATELLNGRIIQAISFIFNSIIAKDLMPENLEKFLTPKDNPIDFDIMQKAILYVIEFFNPLDKININIPANYEFRDKLIDLSKQMKNRTADIYVYKYYDIYDKIITMIFNKKTYNLDYINTIHAILILLRSWIKG